MSMVGFMAIIPSYTVSFLRQEEVQVGRKISWHEESFRVSDDDLETFIRVLRQNGITEFTVAENKLS